MTATLILDIRQKVILEKFPLMTFIAELLGTSAVSARHTAVALIDFQKKKAVTYNSAKPPIRPWGNTLPAQCPSCFSLRSWEDMRTSGNQLSFKCKGVDSHGKRCGNIVSFSPPDKYERLPGQEWISVQWL